MQKLTSRQAFDVLSLLIGILGFGIAIYSEFIRDNSPALNFEQITNTNVLDIRENVSDLQVLYQNKDIDKAGQNLQVVVVRISNTGRQSIAPNSYDPKAPLGIAVNGGTVVRTELQGASNGYLQQTLQILASEKGLITFSPVILEPNEWFSVKLLVLQKKRYISLSKTNRKNCWR